MESLLESDPQTDVHPPENPPSAFTKHLGDSDFFQTIDIRHIDTTSGSDRSAALSDDPSDDRVETTRTPIEFESHDIWSWLTEDFIDNTPPVVADSLESTLYRRFVVDAQEDILSGIGDNTSNLFDASPPIDSTAASPIEAIKAAMGAASDTWLPSADVPVCMVSNQTIEDVSPDEESHTLDPYGIDVLSVDYFPDDCVALIDPAATHVAYGTPRYRIYKTDSSESQVVSEWAARLTIPETFWISDDRCTTVRFN